MSLFKVQEQLDECYGRIQNLQEENSNLRIDISNLRGIIIDILVLKREFKKCNANCLNLIDKDYDHEFCDDCKCDNRDCEKIRRNGKFCLEHGCNVCGSDKATESNVCYGHKCKMCNQQKEYSSDLCKKHKCNDCSNQVVEGSLWCKDHTCHIKNCAGKTYKSTKFCRDHQTRN